MKSIQEIYRDKKKTADELLDMIQDNDYIFCAQAAGEPEAILSNLQHLKETGVKNVHLLTTLPIKKYPAFHDQELQGILEHHSWFFNRDLMDAQKEKMVSDIPQNSVTALSKTYDRYTREGSRPVVIATVSPMDKHGYLSLSISAIYEMDLVKLGALVLVEVNPNFPRTFGDTMIHISQVDGLVESDRKIPVVNPAPYTAIDEAIGKNVASLIEDGSTIQLGIGNMPNAIANELKNKKHLGIHTEMFTESMVDLIECGAVDNSMKGLDNGYSVCSFTMGSQRLYDFLDNNPTVLFKSCTYSNDPYTIAKCNKFVSVNATLEVDLTGQCCSESVGPVQYSGTGGQSDTVRGSQMSPGGKSILCMHSTYTTKDENGNDVLHSKIVPFLREGAIVSTSRNDTDYVVTEYGIAWLRGIPVKRRVEELIKIAHPDFRDWLREEAEKNMIW